MALPIKSQPIDTLLLGEVTFDSGFIPPVQGKVHLVYQQGQGLKLVRFGDLLPQPLNAAPQNLAPIGQVNAGGAFNVDGEWIHWAADAEIATNLSTAALFDIEPPNNAVGIMTFDVIGFDVLQRSSLARKVVISWQRGADGAPVILSTDIGPPNVASDGLDAVVSIVGDKITVTVSSDHPADYTINWKVIVDAFTTSTAEEA